MPACKTLLKTTLAVSLAAWLPLANAAGIFTLKSGDFKDGEMMAQKFAGNIKGNQFCTGENASPALSWENVPEGTKSLALTLVDPEGRGGLGVNHLVAYGIPPDAKGFAENDLAKGKGFVGGKSTQGNGHYNGPCPPVSAGVHHYTFTLIATDLAPDALPAGLTREQLFEKLDGHSKGAAGIIGRFGNK